MATYWPEFGANAKHHVTVRTLLSHQAGLCAIDAPMTVATLADPDAVAAAIGAQKPAWTPGERHGYHAVTLGWYESELIRRTHPRHRTIGRYFADEITASLGLDLYIGLPDDVPEERLARIMGDWYRLKMLFHMRTMPRRFVKNFLNPRSITARSFANPKVVAKALRYNDREIRRLELPSFNGTGTARSVAAAYGEFATEGRRLGIDEVTLAALTQQATAPSGGPYDQVLHTDTAFSRGACKPWPGFEFGSPQAFGTPGAGGSMGFADPQLRMGFCYAMNRMGFHLWDDPREVVLRPPRMPPGRSPKMASGSCWLCHWGMRESFEDWQSLGRDLIARGLGAPMLIVADGAPGLTKAIEQCWPASDRQRCCVHRARNLYAKVPDRGRERVKHAYWQALDDAINEQDGKRPLQELVDQLDTEGYTAAARCVADDLDALVVHLRYPLRHRRRWRSTNLLERSLGEVKRRTKVMGRFPGETSCLTLVWAVLDLLITHQTNGIHFNALDRQHLKRARYHGNDQPVPEEVTAA